MKIIVLSLLGLIALPVTSHADEATRKATIELVHLIMPSDAYKNMIDQSSSQMLAAISQRGSQMPADAPARLKKVVMECAPYDEMVGWTADIYAARFSLAEINDLSKFYRTPTGQKMAKALPDLMGEVGKKMGGVMMERMPAALKKYGLNPDGTSTPEAKPASKK
jgi:hypothetical protein